MEDRRPPSKSMAQTSRLTASAGKVTNRTSSCQNCGASKLSECTCAKLKPVASADRIVQQKTVQPLRSVNFNQQAKEPCRIPLGKQPTEKSKSVAIDNKSSPIEKPQIKQLAEEDICLIHNKPLEVVCTMDLTVICSSCAIFGHKGHDFKSLNEFQTDKLKRCQDILELTDGKKGLEEKISSKTTKEKIDKRFYKLK